jgi:hypothetical protein
MKKIKIIKSRPIKEEEVIDQQPQDIAPEKPAITFESNPLEFILQKYPTLNKTLIELLTEEFRDYITGVYIMAPKPTIFKVVLHNNRSFHLIFMGDDKYEAKVSGKKYWLSNIGELQNATMSIAELLMLGTPPSTEGPAEELPAAGGGEETPEETPAEEEGGEEESEVPELKESIIKRFKHKLIESLLLEAPKREYEILTPEAKKIAQDLIKKLKITQDQIKPASSTNIVIYNDDRKNLVDKLEKLGTYGKRTDPNAGNFKVGKISINFKPLMKSGEYYELKPQSLGVTTDKYISINQLKKELIAGLKNHKVLNDEQKEFAIGLANGKNTLSPEDTKDILEDRGFINEILKNLGEPLGAIAYAASTGATEVFFPAAGNYPLVDYFVKKPNGRTEEISAKSSKGKGNLIKAPDVYKKILNKNLKLSPKIKKFFETVSAENFRATIGTMNLIPIFGSDDLKNRYAKFLKKNPGYLDKSRSDKSKGKYGYDSTERIKIEKALMDEINQKINFNEVFSDAVNTIYVKYGFDPKTLKAQIKVIKGEDFDVYLDSKNSVNHDGERVGFQLA